MFIIKCSLKMTSTNQIYFPCFYQAFLDYIVKFYLHTEAGSCYWLVIICKRKGDVNINIEKDGII